MVFHRFQQLPAELRLQIWEFAIDESLLIDGLVTDGQKPICRIVAPQAESESPRAPFKLVVPEDLTIGHVCCESREVLRRCGRLNSSRSYIPTTDVVYIDDYNDWVRLGSSSLRQVRHIAISAQFCYDLLEIQGPSPTALAQLGWRRNLPRTYNSDFFEHVLVCCREIESITIVLPPLEEDMPHYADHLPQAMRPAFLRIVPYSEVQRIRIAGPHSYTTWLRGSSNAKRRYLGPFIKDVTEVWEKHLTLLFVPEDQRRAVTVQAGVFQYLEGPFKGAMRLSSIYKDTGEMEEENQPADQDEISS
ncbi:hypothetical protein INS49_010045 [Diaporthe citri]|uniref:uncharacterized protein n=1 Tax=Diaporthe citri TaxID=83186 RepID=UPI001C7EC5E5|nr:uncharacterized protein INS49_010045 [Diaporthe citri]KAG6361816.1 hypothetical protein INS49_010045 [Diaporthe citri]